MFIHRLLFLFVASELSVLSMQMETGLIFVRSNRLPPHFGYAFVRDTRWSWLREVSRCFTDGVRQTMMLMIKRDGRATGCTADCVLLDRCENQRLVQKRIRRASSDFFVLNLVSNDDCVVSVAKSPVEGHHQTCSRSLLSLWRYIRPWRSSLSDSELRNPLRLRLPYRSSRQTCVQ